MQIMRMLFYIAKRNWRPLHSMLGCAEDLRSWELFPVCVTSWPHVLIRATTLLRPWWQQLLNPKAEMQMLLLGTLFILPYFVIVQNFEWISDTFVRYPGWSPPFIKKSCARGSFRRRLRERRLFVYLHQVFNLLQPGLWPWLVWLLWYQGRSN